MDVNASEENQSSVLQILCIRVGGAWSNLISNRNRWTSSDIWRTTGVVSSSSLSKSNVRIKYIPRALELKAQREKRIRRKQNQVLVVLREQRLLSKKAKNIDLALNQLLAAPIPVVVEAGEETNNSTKGVTRAEITHLIEESQLELEEEGASMATADEISSLLNAIYISLGNTNMSACDAWKVKVLLICMEMAHWIRHLRAQ